LIIYSRVRPTELTSTQLRHHQWEAAVLRVFDREKGKVGRDQVTTILNREGVRIANGTVGSIMGAHHLQAIRIRAWKKTTKSDPGALTSHISNHLLDADGKRDFTSLVPGTRLCGDITYLQSWAAAFEQASFEGIHYRSLHDTRDKSRALAFFDEAGSHDWPQEMIYEGGDQRIVAMLAKLNINVQERPLRRDVTLI
jgi:transposase InsO family protein